MLRRPLRQVQAAGLQIERRERCKAGMVERLAAANPPPDSSTSPDCLPAFGILTPLRLGLRGIKVLERYRLSSPSWEGL